ncbi:acyltransferase family protein [uncultured Methylobacterium sp.]|uniref:acyltransferase family protein n=1 Tax=uncultured Methylobacterium sp. TaxID=157278 RepID=UPI00343CA487
MRAVAVGAVVVYHCGFAHHAPGGFVGVDVFFVISGFLLTGIIRRETERKTFTCRNFYIRRIRRLLPAAIVMYLAVAVLAFLLMMPSDTSLVAKGILSSLAFVSNIFLYRSHGYFDVDSETNPVLHTWSLSVEEQFYIALPLLMLALRTRSRATISALFAILMAISLGLAVWMVPTDQSAAFYLLQYRAWELLLGSLVALGVIPFRDGKILNSIIGAVGLALILASMILLSSADPFPGITAVPACVGTSLILYSGQSSPTMTSRLLALKPLRFVGLMSYSFYLWHWPIWVFASLVFFPENTSDRLVIIGVSFIVAVLSWRFVEQPFRRSISGAPSDRVLYAGGGAIGLTGLAALFLPVIASHYWKISPAVEYVAAFAKYNPEASFRYGQCFLGVKSDYSDFRPAACLAKHAERKNVVLIGDSFAAHLYPGLASLDGVNVMQANASGCKPVDDSRGADRCVQLVDFVLNDFLAKYQVDVVIFSARWTAADMAGLSRAVEKAKRSSDKVIVIGPMVEYSLALPRLLASGLHHGDAGLVEKHRASGPKLLDRSMKDFFKDSGVDYVSLYEALCPDDRCATSDFRGDPLQFDYGHLTESGSRFVVRLAGISSMLDLPPR